MPIKRLTNQRAAWLAELRARFPAGLTVWRTDPPSTVWRGTFPGRLARPAAAAWAVDVPPAAYASLFPDGGAGFDFVELRAADPPAWYPVPAPTYKLPYARRIRASSSDDVGAGFGQLATPVIAWYAADRQNVYGDGDSVPVVFDSGPAKIHLRPPAGAIGPAFAANVANGLPAFRFALRDYELAASATPTTIVGGEANWATDMWAGLPVAILSGTGAGQQRTVASNTINTITVTQAWTTTPDATSWFAVGLTTQQYVVSGGVPSGGALPAPYNPWYNPWTEVAVCVIRSRNTHNNPILWSKADGGGGDTYLNTSNNSITVVHAGSFSSTIAPALNAPFILYNEVRNAPDATRIRINGVERSGAGPDGGSPGPYVTCLTLGSGVNNGHPTQVDILEVAFLAGALSSKDQGYIEHYCSAKYKVASL